MSILASDNFTRADNADLGTSWDECTGESSPDGLQIITNAAWASVLSQDSSETNNAATWPDDQYATIVFGSVTSDGVGAGVGPTCRAATGATKTYYRLVGCGSGYELGRKVAGAYTSLSSGAGTTFASTNSLTLEVRTSGANCDWVLKKNGTSFASGTDTSPIASGRAGIAHSSTTTSTTASSWEGGDFPGGGGQTVTWVGYIG